MSKSIDLFREGVTQPWSHNLEMLMTLKVFGRKNQQKNSRASYLHGNFLSPVTKSSNGRISIRTGRGSQHH